MMRFEAIQQSLAEAECDVLVVNLFEGVTQPQGATGAVDRAVDSAITNLIERESFEGKLGHTADLTPCGGVRAAKIVLVGLGKQEELDADKIRQASSAAARRARSLSAKRVATVLHGGGAGGIDPATAAAALVQSMILGTYQFTKHKTADVTPNTIDQVDIVEMDSDKIDPIKAGIARGRLIAEAISYARDLTNEPANIVTPSYLAEQARTIAARSDIDCQIVERDGIENTGMNLLLAVSKGSRQEPKFIIMRYSNPKAQKTVALIGKGITFDSGGINLKPTESLQNMKDDMAGAAAVLAAMRAVGELRPELNVLGLIPATENMIGGNATRVGDIITGLSGKTVEIDNTDAEGRLVIADAAAFAEREKVDEIIDIATLTGACVIALGRGMAGILGTDQSLVDQLIHAGARVGEMLWQLPLYPDYKDNLKSEIADMRNTGGREAGAINGAIFIKDHMTGTPWAHIDIAGPATIDKESPLAPKGATGFGAGTLVEYVLGHREGK